MVKRPARQPLRHIARIFIPGVIIDRVVQAALYPIVLAGPELAKRLEPRVARLCDIPNPSWAERAELTAWLWLLEERDIEPEETATSAPVGSVSQPFDPEQQGLPQEIQTLLWEKFGIGQASDPQRPPLEATQEDLLAPPASEVRGAR